MGVARQIKALDDHTFCYASSEGSLYPAVGVFGGGNGSVSRIIRNYGTASEISIPANQPDQDLTAGESVRIETPGGGGFGFPDQRLPEAIAADLKAGKISRKAALLDYGAQKLTEVEGLLPA